MSDISKHASMILTYYLLIIISDIITARHIPQQNGTNSSEQFQESNTDQINQTLIDGLTTLDYDFFSYDVIDHRRLLVKFDITRTIFFRNTRMLYDGYLYISKLPSVNYNINIGPFSGSYEKEIDGTIIDHFTFCLVLIPNQQQNSSLKINTTDTIYQELFTSTDQGQQHVVHYCTKIGPDEDRHRHHLKQGSEGDHILLLLQLLMIVIFLAVLQIAHTVRNQKSEKWHLRRISRFRREILSRRDYHDMPDETLAMLRFIAINNDELHKEPNDLEKQEENPSTVSHRQLPFQSTKLRRSQSPTTSNNPDNIYMNTTSIEHILHDKPWLQIAH